MRKLRADIGQYMNELQKTTSKNTGLVEQYFETNNSFINPTKTHYSPIQTK
jgi:flagellar biosynthesis/type III secretory pathway chaperone